MARYKEYSYEQKKLIPLSYERQILLYGIIGGQPSAFYHHSGFYIDAAGRDHLGVPTIGQLRKGANVARSFWSGSVK